MCSDAMVTEQWSSNDLLPDIAGYKYQEVLTGFTSWLQTWLWRLLVGRVPTVLKNLGISGNLKRFTPGKVTGINIMLTSIYSQLQSISFLNLCEVETWSQTPGKVMEKLWKFIGQKYGNFNILNSILLILLWLLYRHVLWNINWEVILNICTFNFLAKF